MSQNRNMQKQDILNREVFVAQLLKLIENISLNKSSTCFALNGAWGCGKSFVLDMLEEQLEPIQSEETCNNRYFVIRYNSWQFDYYEEPLIAIVSSLLNIIEEKTKLFPDSEEKCKMLGALKAIGVTLLSIGAAALKEKTGLDIQDVQEAYKTVQEGRAAGAAAYANKHDYDAYFSFNKVMEQLTSLLQNLAEKYTIIFLVDELDRCVPDYAIKVLERLHHLTEYNSNILTIISMDKEQLISSVKQLFGFNDPAKYLEKFISFEVKLDYGTVSKEITDKYADYIALFDKSIFPFNDSVEECMQAIFKNIDIRKQEQLMQKVMLVHKLLYTEKKDYSFMCMELLLAVMICVYQDNSCFSDISIDLDSLDRVFMPSGNSRRPAFVEFFEDKFKKISLTPRRNFTGDAFRYLLPEKTNLYGAILLTWYWMHPSNSGSIIQYKTNGVYESISNNHEELKKYAETIKIIS